MAMKGVRKLLLLRTSPAPEGLFYIAEKRRNQPIQDPKMDHLVCFLPGKDPACNGHWELGRGLGCRGGGLQVETQHHGEYSEEGGARGGRSSIVKKYGFSAAHSVKDMHSWSDIIPWAVLQQSQHHIVHERSVGESRRRHYIKTSLSILSSEAGRGR